MMDRVHARAHLLPTYALSCLMEQAKELVNYKRDIARYHVPANVLDTVDIIHEIFDGDTPMETFKRFDERLGVIR